MEPILDSLTSNPVAQLFELDPPRYTSSYGRRTDAVFKNSVPPAPMLFSQDQGLVLYERVISTKAEHQLLEKLTKPRFYHHVPTTSKHGGSSYSSPRKGVTQHSAPSTSADASRADSAEGSGSGAGGERAGGGRGGGGGGGGSGSGPRPTTGRSHPLASTPPEGSGRGGAAAAAVAAAAAAAAAPGMGGAAARRQSRQTKSMSPGRAGAGATAAAGAAAAAAGAALNRKPLHPEDGPLKDYFSKERASVTATTVFTWGNRYKIGSVGAGSGVTGGGGGGGGGGRGRNGGVSESMSFASHTPAQPKPPLRL